jgi:uncharacterized oligopeptide transporter (OPT) family protein
MMRIPEESGGSGFGARSVALAVALSLFLLATSIYIALRLGALPWPIIFSVIVSAGILRLISRSAPANEHEINVAQAGGTIGGLMASAVAFTIPGILFLRDYMNVEITMLDPYVIAAVCVSGGVLGVLLSIPLRRTFVDEEQLPYPSGAAGAEILKAQMRGGRGALLIAFVVLMAGLFALVRDLYIPMGVTATGLATYGIYLTFSAMPLGVGVGYILGPRISINSWFTGALAGWIVIIPLLVMRDWVGSNAITFVQNAGLGIVLGSGVGFFVAYVLPRLHRIFAPLFKWEGPWYFKLSPFFSLVALAVLIAIGVPILATIISVAGVWVMTTIAARMTGETNIDPLEQFGIIVGLVALGTYSAISFELSYLSAFIIVTFVSVAAALAGDIGHDYKSAHIIGTKPKDIIKVDLICAVIVGIAAPFILEVVLNGYADVLFTAQMPAPQAQLVAGSIFGFAYPNAFYAGFGIAFIYEVIVRVSRRDVPASAMAFGIGMFLGLALAILLAIGGLIRILIRSRAPSSEHTGILVSAGLMGGEGIAGFLTAALFVMGIAMTTASYAMIAIFGLAFVLVLIYTLWNRRWYSSS